MNCYNGEKYLQETLESVLNQTYPNWELVFIDNHSTDQSAQIINSYNEPRFKYYKTPHKMTLCQARVWAKDKISGEYFCVLDSDDIILPTKLEKQVKIFSTRPEIGLIYTNSLFFQNTQKEILCYKKPMPSGNISSQIINGYFFSLETLMVRQSIMQKHNLFFSPRYNVCSDMELFTKIALQTQCYYIDEPLAKWRFGHGSTTEEHFESFPKEHELLLQELQTIIPNFQNIFHQELKVRKANIANMYGISEYQKNNISKAQSFFKEASKNNKKYYLNYLFSILFKYNTYKKIRNFLGKI